MKEIVQKFINNECSKHEIELLIEYIQSHGTSADLPAVEEVLSKLESYQVISQTESNRIVYAIFETAKNQRKQLGQKYFWRVAASVAFLIFSMIWIYYSFQKQPIEYRTIFGEVKTITLPDGSSVVLNGNSRLSYSSTLVGDSIRTVSVEGEAFFDVVHTKNNSPFIVIVNDEFKVEVLGTKFNIQHRRGRSNVVLNEGSVKVTIRKEKQVQQITIKPGEAITFLESNKVIEKNQVQPEKSSSWKNAKLVLDNMLMKEVIQRMEDTYGVHVQISDPSILSLKLWGTVPCNSLDNLIKGIEASFNLQIVKEGDTISISKSVENLNPVNN